MKLEQMNPHIRYANIHRCYILHNQNSICYDCRLFYIEKGAGKLCADDKIYNISNQSFVFLPPKTKYKFLFDQIDNIKILVFNFDLTDKFSEIKHSLGTALEQTFDEKKCMNYALPKEFSDVIVQDNLFQIQELLTKCVNEFLEKSIYYCITASAMLKLCLIESLKKNVKFGPNQELAGRIQKYIHNHYHLQELTNEDVAKEFNYHPFYLSRVMKEATGKTLHQYLVYYRIHMAKNYLITTDLNICMIADITGFSSCSHFIKIFREQTGVTPRQYKKTHINFGF